jgi:hypothetical protein
MLVKILNGLDRLPGLDYSKYEQGRKAMGLTAEQENLLKSIFLSKEYYTTDLARTAINDFMNNFLADYKNAMVSKYFRYLKNKAPSNWFEELLQSCKEDTTYSKDDKDKFLSDMKREKEAGNLSDYECAKAFMQGGERRKVKDTFLINIYKYCDKDYQRKNTKGQLDTTRKINLVLTRVILLCNTLSGVQVLIEKICTSAKTKAQNGTPRRDQLQKMRHQLFYQSTRNCVLVAGHLNKDSGLFESLAPFKGQFEAFTHIKEIRDARLKDEFWGEYDDTLISLIARIKKLLECFETEKAVNLNDMQKRKIEEFKSAILGIETYFCKYSEDFMKLYVSLEKEVQPTPIERTGSPSLNQS